MKKIPEKLTEFDVAKRLARRYPSPAWAFLTRVRRGTGYSTSIRTADALAMSLFPSRGFEIQGFEIKVSKNDWKKELADPEKSVEIQQFCHRWWIVVPDESLITLSEVPQNWGVIIAKANGNSVLKDAPYLKAKPIDYPFLGAIFRNLNENTIHKDDFNTEVKLREEQWVKGHAYNLKQANERLAKLKEFEEISGIRIETWGESHKEIAKVVKLVLEMKGDLRWKFESLHKYAKEICEALEGMEKEMKVISTTK